MTKFVFLAGLVLLAACRDEQPPAPTAQQADQLNEAEDLLNSIAQNEQGPEANASGPSNRSN